MDNIQMSTPAAASATKVAAAAAAAAVAATDTDNSTSSTAPLLLPSSSPSKEPQSDAMLAAGGVTVAAAIATTAAAIGTPGESASGGVLDILSIGTDYSNIGRPNYSSLKAQPPALPRSLPVTEDTPPPRFEDEDGDEDEDDVNNNFSNNDTASACGEDETMSSSVAGEEEEEVAPSSSLHEPSLPSSPSQGAASSEEDSVAEMDYMSEGSNLSLKGLQPAASVLGEETNDNSSDNNNNITMNEATVEAVSAAAAAAEAAAASTSSFVVPSVSQLFMNKARGFLPTTKMAASASASIEATTQDLLSHHNSITSSSHLSSFRRYHASSAGGGTGAHARIAQQPASNHDSSNTAGSTSTSSSCLRLGKKVPASSSLATSGGGGGTGKNNATNGINTPFANRFLPSATTPTVHMTSGGSGSGSGGGGGGFRGFMGAETIIQPPGSFDTPGDHRKLLSASGETFEGEHRPLCLPRFRNTPMCMWTASHAANYPTEDRSASLVNLLLQPLPPNFDSETQLLPLEPDYKTLIRLNLWAVIDGHGGGCVATYASEVLLPHIAASVSRALDCAIVDRGVCTVNGQLRDANALDLDGLIKTSDRSMGNPYSIHYRSPYERSDSEEEGDGADGNAVPEKTAAERKQLASLVKDNPSMVAEAGSIMPSESAADASVSSVKTSVKTAASPANREALVGTHSPREVAAITRAITESFLAVDEGWINSIDPVATHQTSCQSNGRWNSGACALVVFTIQRLDWTSVSEPDREKESRGPKKSRRNTSQNRDAARRRMLDYAARAKSASSMSTVSSTSSLTTEEAVNASGLESEITETEGEDDRIHVTDVRKRNPYRASTRASQFHEESLISPPGGCSCHCYRAHDAILYTAHVGDCRAVMLGSAPPRTIKVRGRDVRGGGHHPDTTDDESSHHSSDETECLSSSDHDADSSEDEDLEIVEGSSANAATSSYMNFPRRVVRQRNSRRRANDDFSGPFNPLPPLESKDENASKRVEFDFDTDTAGRELRRLNAAKEPSDSSTSSQDSDDLLPLVHLAPVTRPIDLTTDHSAYNPAEVTAVLRRCNNAPRAISAGVGGGIKRVAGSLAVTRALGDAYLKTPLLSFLPYKSHAPYITGRPDVNCRPLVKEHDKVLILATDGVWERASGEDVLRWVRNFYEERVAEAERRSNRRLNQFEKSTDKDKGSSNEEPDTTAIGNNSQEAAERDLFERNDGNERHHDGTENTAGRKREIENGSPSPPAKRRKRSRQNRISYNVADVIVRRVLNKVRRARNISSLQALMSLPQGRARRSKHDDITSSVVDLSAFVS